jgi:alkylation response protein AidB-like acyl-CoA dehydrogenase
MTAIRWSETSTAASANGKLPPPVEAARALAPRIREAAKQIEDDRQLPRPLVEAMLDAGLFHIAVPTEYGGSQADPATIARTVEEVAFADGSAGWCIMIASQNAVLAGFMPPGHAREVLSGRNIMCGTARPIGRAVATNDPAPGYIVSGRWPFASGSSHATWFGGECVVYDGDQPRKDANGNDVTRMIPIPRDSVTIIDTWDTTGLRGTASNDFVIENAWAPEARGMQMLVTPPAHPWPLYQALALIFTTHGGQALGVARAAIETAAALAASKPGWGTTDPMSHSPRLQAIFARAVAEVESARAFLYGAIEACWQALLAGAPEDEVAPLRARVRLANSHAATASVRAVDLVHDALATSAVFRKTPLERQFRDIHTASAHVMIGPMTYESAGRVELGLPPNFPFF